MIYKGGCHCGAVQFEVEAPESMTCQDCNCSICSTSGYRHLIVPKSAFKLLQGENTLTTYTFDSAEAKHTFCKIFGIKFFFRAQTLTGIVLTFAALIRSQQH